MAINAKLSPNNNSGGTTILHENFYSKEFIPMNNVLDPIRGN